MNEMPYNYRELDEFYESREGKKDGRTHQKDGSWA